MKLFLRLLAYAFVGFSFFTNVSDAMADNTPNRLSCIHSGQIDDITKAFVRAVCAEVNDELQKDTDLEAVKNIAIELNTPNQNYSFMSPDMDLLVAGELRKVQVQNPVMLSIQDRSLSPSLAPSLASSIMFEIRLALTGNK